jgi:hypothetical protein
MNEEMSDLPQAETADPDGVQVALRAAQTLWSRGETSESLKWLRKAAESASDEGADVRSLQLAKAAAELRHKLFGTSVPPRTRAAEISGAHPIDEQPARASIQVESEGVRSSSFPPGAAEPFTAAGEHVAGQSSRPVTATQYPSHRPRQRMGLTSAGPGGSLSPRDAAYGTRESAAYAAVPSWSADSERRISAAPPPLPLAALDDYEELEAEPDDEPADDPGSVWSSAASDSWPASEPAAEGAANEPSALQPSPGAPLAASLASAGAGGVLAVSSSAGLGASVPPPLPPRGAFSDDDPDFGLPHEPPTVMIPPPDEAEGASLAREARRLADIWDRESRLSGWDQDAGSSWAAEVRSSWGSVQAAGAGSLGANLGAVPGAEGGSVEPPPPSDTAPAKLTARVHHQAVRVSFSPDMRVPGQYVVRPLREGEKAGAGERIALLVALEPGMPLV